MKTCIIDNFDSFTFNLVDLVARAAILPPRVIKNNQMPVADIMREDYDNIIISPGPGTVENKKDIGVCLDVIADTTRPLLGVCLGHQAIAYHYGGRAAGIIKIAKPVHGKATLIFHDGMDIFDGLPNPLMVGRYHSLVVDEKYLAKDLKITARDNDGNIMAVAHRTKPIYGVQFHPESILTAGGKKMIENFFAITKLSKKLSGKSSGASSGKSSGKSSGASSGKSSGKSSGNNVFVDESVASADGSVSVAVADGSVSVASADGSVSVAVASPPVASPSTQPEKNNKKIIICQEWSTKLSMASIVADYFLPQGAAMWLDGDEATGWGHDGFSYIGGNSGGSSNSDKSIIMVDDLSSSKNDFFDKIAKARQEFAFDDKTVSTLPTDIADADFFGGPMGFLSYEGRVLCPDAFATPPRQAKTTATPDGFFILADRLLIENKTNGKKYLLAVGEESDRNHLLKWIEDMTLNIISKSPQNLNNNLNNNPNNKFTANNVSWRFDKSKDDYIANINKAIDAIKQGQVYQLCLTNQLTANFTADNAPSAFSLYQHLRNDNNTPYRGFLAMPSIDKTAAAILCFSPEEFLQLSPSGKITTKPIKGTARRGGSASEDEALSQQLLLSEKNRAENIMIVDLLRNDMTRVAAHGSIIVEKTCALETFDKVHQLVSTVTAQLFSSYDIVDLVRSAFPGGSMTGAPKIRAMELIAKMEDRRRGVYSGAFGYMARTSSLAMVIRTLMIENKKDSWHYSLGVGSGIVVDSNPDEEWQELLWKAAGIIDSLKKIMTVKVEE